MSGCTLVTVASWLVLVPLAALGSGFLLMVYGSR